MNALAVQGILDIVLLMLSNQSKKFIFYISPWQKIHYIFLMIRNHWHL